MGTKNCDSASFGSWEKSIFVFVSKASIRHSREVRLSWESLMNAFPIFMFAYQVVKNRNYRN